MHSGPGEGGNHVVWTDVAPRDGLQNISEHVTTDVKVRLVAGLLAAGAPRVEATAFVSPQWVPQMADAADVLAAIEPGDRNRIRVLIPNLRGLELALAQGAHNVLVTIAESRDDLSRIVARAQDASCQVDVALSVSFGCPFEGHVEPQRVVDLCREIAARGAVEIGIADTIGVANPVQVDELCRRCLDVAGPDRLSLHVHDTRGLGVAHVLMAYWAGVRRFDGSAGGVGGCPFAPRSTGNVASEDALAALMSVGATIDADLPAYCAVSERLAADLGHDLPGKLYRAGIWDAAAAVAAHEEESHGRGGAAAG